MTDFEKMVVFCECHSSEHQFILVKDQADGEVWMEIHLTQHDNFFKRLWTGLKYALGYRSRYGHFDCVLISKEDQSRMVDLLTDNKKGS